MPWCLLFLSTVFILLPIVILPRSAFLSTATGRSATAAKLLGELGPLFRGSVLHALEDRMPRTLGHSCKLLPEPASTVLAAFFLFFSPRP